MSCSNINSLILEFISKNNLIQKNDNICIALSGGVDSVFLLHFMLSIKKQFDLELTAIHIDHNIRKEASAQDARFTQKICSELHIPLSLHQLESDDMNPSEEKLRNARYHIFESHHRANPQIKIATAHHSGDQVETFLMRLAKGSSLKGLSGIPAKRDCFIRPLLSITKEQIVDKVREMGWEYREDSSNKSDRYLRNRIRNKVYPVLTENFGEPFTHSVLKSISEISLFEQYARKRAKTAFDHLLEGADRFRMDRYLALEYLERRLFIEYCFYVKKILNCRLAIDRFRRIDRFINGANSGTMFHLCDEMYLLRDREYLIFVKNDKDQQTFLEYLEPGETILFDGNRITLKYVRRSDVTLDKNKNLEFICGTSLSFPLTARYWRKGDYFYPLGMKHKKKISDFFVDNKINILKKHKIPLIFSENQLVWVAGYRLDNRFKMTDKCTEIYALSMDG
jgi:tRNA(Ile)-lysidine synthase